MFGLTLIQKDAFEVGINKGNAFLGNEAMVRKAINDIYPTIKDDIDVFLHVKNYTEQTKPTLVLNDILKFYSESTSENWLLINEKKKYKIKQIYTYPVCVEPHVIDMSMIFALDTDRTKEIYNLILYLVNVLEQIGFSGFDSNSDTIVNSELEMMRDAIFQEELEEEELQEIKGCIETYTHGAAKEMVDRMQSVFYTNASIIRTITSIEQSIKNANYKGDLFNHLKKAVDLSFKIKDKKVYQYIIPNEDSSDIEVHKAIMVVYDSDDLMFKNMSSGMDDRWGNSSNQPEFKIYVDAGSTKPLDTFPYELMEYVEVIQLLFSSIWNETKNGFIKPLTD